MFYSGNLLRTIAQETASQITLRNRSEELREEPGYSGVFAEKKNVVKCQRLLLITKHRCIKLMILVLFYVWEDARVQAH